MALLSILFVIAISSLKQTYAQSKYALMPTSLHDLCAEADKTAAVLCGGLLQ